MVSEKKELVLFASFVNCLLAFVIAVTVALTPSASHYEISIYSVYPSWFWLLVLTSLMMPFTVLMLAGRSAPTRYMILFTGSLLSLTILLALPILRGYAFYSGGDASTHLGYVKDIQAAGHYAKNDLYPIIHILIASGAFATGLDAKPLMSLVPLAFTLFYSVSIFLLARVLTKDSWRSAAVFAFAIVPLFGAESLYTVPSAEAFFVIPITIFLYLKSTHMRTGKTFVFSLALIVFLILLPFFHVEPALFMLVILVFLTATVRRHNVTRTTAIEVAHRTPKSSAIPASILMVAFFAWFTTSIAFGSTVRVVYDSFILNIGVSPVSSTTSILSKYHVNPLTFASLFMLTYGPFIICFSLAALSVIQSAGSMVFGKKVWSGVRTFSGLFIIFSVIVALFMLTNLIIGGRTIKYLLLVSTVLAGLEVCRLRFGEARQSRSIARPAIAIGLVVLMASTTGLAVMALCPSPLTRLPNYQVTQTDFDGMAFYFLHRNDVVPTMGITMDESRFKDAILGVSANSPNIGYVEVTRPPDHFGYNATMHFGDSCSNDSYFITDARDEQIYPSIYPDFQQFWRFTQTDFSELGSDPTVDLVCANGGFSWYLIQSASPSG
jgi:hypothetical protein